MLRVWSPDGGAIEWTQPKIGTYAITKLANPSVTWNLIGKNASLGERAEF